MKKLFALAAAAALITGAATVASAQVQVTLASDLSVATDNDGESVYAATYSRDEDKFLSSVAGANVRVYNGATGAYESNLDMTGINLVDLGIFALAAGSDGSIFAMEDGTGSLWQWDNVAAAPVQAVASGVAFARCGVVLGTGNNTLVALTGSANNGPIEVYGTTDDVTYTLDQTIPAVEIEAKSSMAVNSTVTAAWAVGDTHLPITKAVDSGGWAADPAFNAPTSGNGTASLAYDDANNILFGIKGTVVTAYDADTGDELANVTVAEGLNPTAGYAGGVVVSTPGSGTVYFAGRGVTTTECVMNVVSYTVLEVTAASRAWTLY